MTAHISDELPRLLTGEANREDVLAAAEHLRSCVDCQHELVSAVVAHASLTSAQRFAPGIVSGVIAGNFTDPDRTESAGNSTSDAASDDHAGQDDQKRPPQADAEFVLPDLSAVFAQVRREAAEPPRTTHASRHPSRLRYAVGAAAAAVLLGSGAAVYVATSGSDNSNNPPSASRVVKLAAYDTGKAPASAKIDGGEMRIDASALPDLTGKRYEVWLTNDARTKMQPVGWLAANGTAAMTVPADLMSQYQDIEISVQQVDANDYAYSGTSVLRGSIE